MYQIRVYKKLYIMILCHNFGRKNVNKIMLNIHFLGKSYQKQVFLDSMSMFKVQQKFVTHWHTSSYTIEMITHMERHPN
jgi:hypothetical protein